MIARQIFLLFKKSTTFWDNPRTIDLGSDTNECLLGNKFTLAKATTNANQVRLGFFFQPDNTRFSRRSNSR